MTRQYKSMQEELTNKCNDLENQSIQNLGTIDYLKREQERVNKEKEDILNQKNEEINALK